MHGHALLSKTGKKKNVSMILKQFVFNWRKLWKVIARSLIQFLPSLALEMPDRLMCGTDITKCIGLIR